MKQHMVSNTKSSYFGLTVYETERYESLSYGEIWVKVVLDFSNDGTFKEIETWFKLEELVDY